MIWNHQHFNFHAAHRRFALLAVCLSALWHGHVPGLRAAELLVGAASTSITPEEPVALSGQFHTRVAKAVESPVTADVLALESLDGDKSLDLAIMVSCDLVVIREDIQSRIRNSVSTKLPEVDVQKLFVSATHTHTAPVMVEGKYVIPSEGVIQPAEYVEFLVEQVSDAVVKAWNVRKPAGVSWGLSVLISRGRQNSFFDSGGPIICAPEAPFIARVRCLRACQHTTVRSAVSVHPHAKTGVS
jgi:hypothetical protein